MDFEAPERRREIFAMSLGNVLSGVFGGLPVTGVLVRTAVNIDYGAESRASQLINSGYTLVITLLLLNVFAFMPLPAIAAMLICSAVNLGKASGIKLVEFA
jgi:carbonic anhydrase